MIRRIQDIRRTHEEYVAELVAEADLRPRPGGGFTAETWIDLDSASAYQIGRARTVAAHGETEALALDELRAAVLKTLAGGGETIH